MSDPPQFPFTDHRGAACVLWVDPEANLFEALWVEHPRCEDRARVSADLDAFYCTACRWNGRISGAWAVDMWQRSRAATAREGGPSDE